MLALYYHLCQGATGADTDNTLELTGDRYVLVLLWVKKYITVVGMSATENI